MKQRFIKEIFTKFIILCLLQLSLPLNLYAYASANFPSAALITGAKAFNAEEEEPASEPAPPPYIYDSETLQLLKDYAAPLLKVAQPKSIPDIKIIASPMPGAFTDGKSLFIDSGLITFAQQPNQVIGVLAHELGHMTYGHIDDMLAKAPRYVHLAKLTTLIFVNLLALPLIFNDAMPLILLSEFTVFGGNTLLRQAVKGSRQVHEMEADRVALSFLAATGQSSRGLIEYFANLRHIWPILTKEQKKMFQEMDEHLSNQERVRFLEDQARRSPYFAKKDSPLMVKRHLLAQAKIIALAAKAGRRKEVIYQYFIKRTGLKDKESQLALAYALAIYDSFKSEAKPIKQINNLIRQQADNPFFYELLADAYYNQQDFSAAITQYQKAIKLFEQRYSNKANDLYYKLGKSWLKAAASQDSAPKAKRRYSAKQQLTNALNAFISAQKIIAERPEPYYYAAQAAGQLGASGLADYFLGEMYFQQKQFAKARIFAGRSLKQLAKDSIYRAKAQDILNYDQPPDRF